MDAVKYLNEQNRMCNSFVVGCNGCPIYGRLGCTKWIKNNPEKAVEIVEQWSKEHPVKTRADLVRKNFINFTGQCCPKIFEDYQCPHDYDCNMCFQDYWKAPAPEGFGKGGADD